MSQYTITPEPSTGTLPRKLSNDVLWAGSCLGAKFEGETVHGHFGVYVVKTANHVYMVDTAHTVMGDDLEQQLDDFLGDAPVDFIYPTHPEIPHAGLLSRWLKKYENAVVIGDTTDYHLYYPEEYAAGKFVHFNPGEALDLGDRTLTFVPAIWRDLPNSIWAHDSYLDMLFVADAFAFLHPHDIGDCDKLASEHDTPNLEMAQFFNNAALFWTRFGGAEKTFPDIDDLLTRLKPRYIAPAHGSVCDTVDQLLPFFKKSLAT